MKVLLIRHDADGAYWKEYPVDFNEDYDLLLEDMKAHINTLGVTRLEIIPQTQ